MKCIFIVAKSISSDLKRNYDLYKLIKEHVCIMEFCITMEVSVLFLCKLKLSSKMKELEEKTAEQKELLELREDLIRTQQKLNEMERLKEEERINEVRREAEDLEIQAVLQQLTQCQEEIKTLTQERDDLKHKGESLQAETEQLREDIKDTVSMVGILHF